MESEPDAPTGNPVAGVDRGLHLVEQLRGLNPATRVILPAGGLFDSHVVEDNLKLKISGCVSKAAPLQTLGQEIRGLIGS